jgi:cell division septation protein DedD
MTPPASSTLAPTPTTAAAPGSYWVQVGAFKSEQMAKQVAAKLRQQNYEVEESTTQQPASASSTATGSNGPVTTDRYDVFVSGVGAADLNGKLAAKGLTATAEGVAGGVVIKPSLPLRDAVALSRDLTADGMKVQVKRANASSASAPAASSGSTLYRVRVGKFADRAAARAAAKELEAKGYKVFIARGPA